MYKTLLLFGLLFCILSCSTDDCVEPKKEITKNIVFDSQDNVIKVDDGMWLNNSNYDYDNWIYKQEYGVKWVDSFLYLHYDESKYELINAEFYNFPYYQALSLDENGYYLESPDFSKYINDTDVFYIKLKLKEK